MPCFLKSEFQTFCHIKSTQTTQLLNPTETQTFSCFANSFVCLFSIKKFFKQTFEHSRTYWNHAFLEMLGVHYWIDQSNWTRDFTTGSFALNLNSHTFSPLTNICIGEIDWEWICDIFAILRDLEFVFLKFSDGVCFWKVSVKLRLKIEN